MMVREIEGQIESVIGQFYSAASVSVMRDGEILYSLARGILDPRDSSSRTQVSSLFDLASITKSVIAVLTLRLYEQGRLDLAQTVASTVPEFSEGSKREVTLSQLLSHTSGLPASFNLYEPVSLWNRGKSAVSEALFNVPLESSPGTVGRYSCLGYMLLGVVLERLTNARLDDLVRTEITGRLGIPDLTYLPHARSRVAVTTFSRPRRGNIAAGIVHDGNAIGFGGVAGNAGLFGSSEAVCCFGDWLLRGRVIRPDLVALAATPHARDGTRQYGLGWRLNVDRHVPFADNAFGHTGFTGTALWVDPHASLCVAILTNMVHFRDRIALADFEEWRTQLYSRIQQIV